jgi:dihydroorotate dehydrogenase (NAD+) catalytic subunit
MDLEVKIGNSSLKNPVTTASGTFGYGGEFEDLIDLSKLGAIFTKAVTPEPRLGNDIPRIAETTAGMLNSIGLANVGVERFKLEKLPKFKSIGTNMIINVAGTSSDDYERVVNELDEYDDIWGYELNLSCPNVKEGCLLIGTEPSQVTKLTMAVRKRTQKPIIVKLTPNVTSIGEIAKAAEAGGADAVSCINTLVGMKIDIHRKKAVLPMKTGGLSGPAILPVGIAAVYKVAGAVSIPVIGIGGIQKTEDAIQYLLAGAHAVQIGTANFFDPDCSIKILSGIQQYMEEESLSSIEDFHQFTL